MRNARKLVVAAALLAAAAARPARADSFVALAEPDYASPAKVKGTIPITSRHVRNLSYPVLGFPSLVDAGGTIPARVLLPDGGATTDFAGELVTQGSVPVRVSLRATGARSYDATTGTYVVELAVPAGTAPGVYDLELSSASFNPKVDRQPCCVRVLDARHLDQGFAIVSDTQAQDIRTTVVPQRIKEMLDEVRLRDPAFVLYCGDVNFGTDYSTEYEENWQLFARSGLAIFFVPGNHDSYATVIPGTNGPVVQRDGVEQWKETFGPTLYSFDWGKHHFVGVNSSGGSAQRRNALGILVTNYGGEVGPAELAWIEKDVKDATARGKKSVLFMHHDPAGSLDPNKSSYPLPIPTFSSQMWNDAASQTELLRIIATYDVSHLLYGHIHHDAYAEKMQAGGRIVKHVATTTLSCGSPSKFGYRWIETKAGLMGELHYMGTSQQSVPIPAVGVNVQAQVAGKNDGTEKDLDATVTSRLLLPAAVTVELAVERPATKLRARGAGAVLESVAPGANGSLVARVRGVVPPSGSLVLGVEAEPAPVATSSAVAPPSSSGASGTVTPASTAATPFAGRGGGGSGCALEHGDADPRAVVLGGALLVAFLLRRRREKL